jgi:hypothetical protein
MTRIQIILIYLGFLGIYVGMTVITVVTAGEYPMGITSEFEARILYMIKARF